MMIDDKGGSALIYGMIDDEIIYDVKGSPPDER